MVEFNINEPLLAPPHMQSVVRWLQIVQQVSCLVDDDVPVRVFALVGGPPRVRKVSRDAIALYPDFVWFEPVIPKQSPENLPRRSRVTGRKFCVDGGFSALKVQHEGPCRELTQGDLLPVALHKPLDHGIDAAPNHFRSHQWS